MLPVNKLSQEITQPENMCDIVFEKTKGRRGTVNRTSVHAEQPSEGFFKKDVQKNFVGKHMCGNHFFDKVKLCRSATSLKMSL